MRWATRFVNRADRSGPQLLLMIFELLDKDEAIIFMVLIDILSDREEKSLYTQKSADRHWILNGLKIA